MKKKLEYAGIRALHTFAQTIAGVMTIDIVMSGITWQMAGRAALAGLIAGAVSFTKSLVAGMPEEGNEDE